MAKTIPDDVAASLSFLESSANTAKPLDKIPATPIIRKDITQQKAGIPDDVAASLAVLEGKPVPEFQPVDAGPTPRQVEADVLGLAIRKGIKSDTALAAHRRDVAAKTGVNPGLVTPQVEDTAFYKEHDPEDLIKNFPAVAKYLGVQGNAELVGKDIGHLKTLETFFRRAVQDPEIVAAKGFVAAAQSLVGIADLNPADLGGLGKTLEANGVDFSKISKVLTDLYTPEMQASIKGLQAGEGFLGTLEAAAKNPAAVLELIGTSVPSIYLGGALARGMMPALPALAAVPMGEGLTMAGSSAEQIRAQDPNKDLDYKQALLAAGVGVAGAGISFLGARFAQKIGIEDLDVAIATGQLSNTLQKSGMPPSVAARIIGGFVSEGAIEEMPQSIVEQIAQNVALSRPWDEGVPEAAALGLVTGGAMGAAVQAGVTTGKQDTAKDDPLRKATDAHLNDIGKAVSAEDQQAALQKWSEEIVNNKLRKESPSAFKEFIKTMADEHSGIKEVFIDAKHLEESLQQSGIKPEEFVKNMPEVARDLQTALATGGEVRIPIEDYATYLAGSKLEPMILNQLRTDPEGMTYSESQTFFQQQKEIFAEKAKEIITSSQPVLTREEFAAKNEGKDYTEYLKAHENKVEAFARDAQEVHDKILGGMNAAKRFNRAVNAVYAVPFREFYAVNAAKEGILPSELYARLPLNFSKMQIEDGGLEQSGTRTVKEANSFNPTVATPDSFTKENVANLINTKNWAIFTAGNPGGVTQDEAANADANAKLLAELDSLGLKYEAAPGRYPGDAVEAESYIVYDIRQKQAHELGNKYGQDSVLTREGLVYHDGSVTPPMGVITFDQVEQASKTGYTRVPRTGAIFTFDLDWSKEKAARQGEMTVLGRHFSQEQRAALEGTRFGAGLPGAEGERVAESDDPRLKTRVAFYVDTGKGIKPEVGLGSVQHDVVLPNIYDASTNPLGFNYPSDRLGGNLFEQQVLDAGYDGYYSKFGDQGAVVVLGDAAKSIRTDNGQGRDEGILRGQTGQNTGVREADGSLQGLPRKVGEFNAKHYQKAEEITRKYMAEVGLPYNPPGTYAKVDPARAKRVADAFDQMKHDPQNPEVKAAYDALVKETTAQYKAVIDSGLVVEFIDFNKTGDPYEGNPRKMTEDVINNNHMWVFSTREGFGSDADFNPQDNPLLAETDFEISGQKALANDLFRVVHDYFGHVKEGVGFRAEGEENAWRAHMSMFSPLAGRALTVETRGQNSWVNFGPFAESNKTASAADTHYADQKIGLLPEWVSTEGAKDEVLNQSAVLPETINVDGVERTTLNSEGRPIYPTEEGIRNFWKWFGDSKVVDEQGRPTVMYHGTSSNFDVFNPGRVGTGSGSYSGKGFYFTPSITEAGGWAEMQGETPSVMPTYIRMDNPHSFFLSNRKWQADESFSERLREGGFDGVIVKYKDTDTETGVVVAEWIGELVAFNPDQIKSAIGNNGDFSSDRNILKQFAGPNALTADKYALATAQQRINAGDNAETVRQETGWFKGVDGKWRFEINDSDAALWVPEAKDAKEMLDTVAEETGEVELQSVMQHERLFAAYPELRTLEVKLLSEDKRGAAVYGKNKKTGSPFIALKPTASTEEILTALLHEIQHGIQKIEGFASGGMPENMTAVLDKKRIDGLYAEDEILTAEFEKLKAKYGNLSPADVPENVRVRTAELRKQIEQVRKKGLDHLQKPITRPSWTKTELNEAYRQLAGEVEARNTQSRMGMTEAERNSTSPVVTQDVPEGEQIVVFNGTEMANAPPPANVVTQGNRAGFNPNTFTMTLLDGSDLSSVIHEGGHFYLEALNEMATRPEAPQQIKDDFRKTLEWFGITGNELGLPGGELLDQKAFHGSPHDHDKFDSSKIGTGEGAQAYGYGHYFAESKDVAEWYKRETTEQHGTYVTINGEKVGLEDARFAPAVALFNEREAGEPRPAYFTDDDNAIYDELYESDAEISLPQPRLYEVELSPEQDEYLLWDRPLSEQSDKVKVALQKGYEEQGSEYPEKAATPPTGRELYQDFRALAGGLESMDSKAASGYLHSLGIRGIKYLDGTSRGTGEGSYNYVVFSDEDITITDKYYQGGETLQPGQLPPGRTPEEIWNNMTLDQKRPYHEQWAESWERYALEGKAPTLEMQPVFARFRAWMLNIYKSMKEFLRNNPLAGKLNDDIRAVFDRLIASDEAIAEAQKARSYAPLFATSEEAGVTDKQFQEYVDEGRRSADEATSELDARSIRDMKWLTGARTRALKSLQAEARTKRKMMRTEVEQDIAQEPVERAKSYFAKGEYTNDNGEVIEAEVKVKLNKAEVRELMPNIDMQKLRGMTSDDGIALDLAAQLTGFSSGEALLKALNDSEPTRDKVAAEVDKRMLEQYGDLVDDAALSAAADEAVHNEARARFMATGLKMLLKTSATSSQLVKAAKQAAEQAIAGKAIRDIRPGQYARAETKANKEALKRAPKDRAGAAEAQRAALLNNKLYSVARDAQNEVNSILKYVRKFDNRKLGKVIHHDYLEQIVDLLSPFEFKNLPLRQIDKNKSLAAWIEEQEANGFQPAIDVDTVEKSKLKNYKDMTLEELRGLKDTIKQVEHLGRYKDKLLTAKDRREFNERMLEAEDSIRENANRTVEERATPTDTLGKMGQWFRQMSAGHRKFSSIIREMDGGKDNGTMWNLLSRAMNEAGDMETEMRQQAAERVASLFKMIELDQGFMNLSAKKRLVPGTDISMTHEQRIMFAMNWGNEGNRQRLLDGGITGRRALSMPQAQSILDTLTKPEWDFVQATWDYVGTYKEQIAALERKMTGVEPLWIEPASIETKFGTYAGGYFPAKYDAELSTRSESLEAVTDLRMGMKGAFGAAATRNGYTQERSKQVIGRPLLLSFNVIPQHVNEVIHRLSWQPWLTDANRVLRHLDSPIREHYGTEILREMRDTVMDIATGDAPAKNATEAAINRLRMGSTIVGMGWRVTTALLQPSGLAQSYVRVGPKWVSQGILQFLTSPNDSAEFADSRSTFMKNRGTTMNREINEVLNTLRTGEGVSNLTASYFWLIAKMQRTVDIPTWIGAYNKGLAEVGYENAVDETQRKTMEDHAVRLADQAVIDSQSSGMTKDLARVQRGSPLNKILTNFYSYFSATYNLNIETVRKTNFMKPAEVMLMANNLIVLNVIPVLFAVALKESIKGNCGDDLECLAGKLANEQISYMLGQMILLREIGAAVGVATGGDQYGYQGPAGLRFFGDLYKAGVQVNQGELDAAFWKSLNNVGGAVLHYPAGQINATFIDGIMAIENGDVEGASILPALLFGPPRD